MFSVVIVSHEGPQRLPSFFQVAYGSRNLCVQVLRAKSLFRLRPLLYSACVSGAAYFGTDPRGLPSDESEIAEDVYKEHLEAHLKGFIPTLKSGAASPAALVKYHFYLGEYKQALALLGREAGSGDTKMLEFIAKHPDCCANYKEKYYAAGTPARAPSSRSDAAPSSLRRSTSEVLKICSGVDTHTALIFALGAIEHIQPLALLELLRRLKTASFYEYLYFAIKAAERLAGGGLIRLGALVLFAAARKIESGQDVQLKNELIRRALQLPHTRSWHAALHRAASKIHADEASRYGKALGYTPVDVDIGRAPLQTPTVRSATCIYEFNIIKKELSDACTGRLRLHNTNECAIDALILDTGAYVPVYGTRARPQANIPSCADDSKDRAKNGGSARRICIKSALLSDGQEVALDASFEILARETDVRLADVQHLDGETVCVFAIEGPGRTFSVDPAAGSCKLRDAELMVHLKPDCKDFKISVEIRPKIFEEMVFYV
ncbi:hypothetical protein PAPHI01_1186 [Pancytospora philotis]|nr:hypothetical protein PAPHI01_1186 [Pancytospora philotis]